jgi:hypothetical protein
VTRITRAGCDPIEDDVASEGMRETVARALRNPNIWLTLTFVGLILLMARTYA